jgi:hypothetical protein
LNDPRTLCDSDDAVVVVVFFVSLFLSVCLPSFPLFFLSSRTTVREEEKR